MTDNNLLIWIDLEMSGLEPPGHRILEIATIITDCQLAVVAEGPVIAVQQADSVLNNMDEWCTRTHGESGLVERVRQSTLSEADAERMTLEFLCRYCKPGHSPMCGNSIGQDRRFLRTFMPDLESFFHYRNLDVSTIKELARRWRPDVLSSLKKRGTHQALLDIQDSIDELKHYQTHFFRMDGADYSTGE